MAGFPVGDAFAHFQEFGPAYHLIYRPEAQLGHDFAQLLRQETKQVYDVLGLAGEELTQLGVLGGHAHGAGVEVAFAHHHAAAGHQRGRGHAPFFGPQKRRYGQVAAGFQLAVGLQHHAAAQLVLHQRLVCFG